MGAPSDDQIDECIADGVARGHSGRVILKRLMTLERLSDEELAELGIYPAPPRRSQSGGSSRTLESKQSG